MDTSELIARLIENNAPNMHEIIEQVREADRKKAQIAWQNALLECQKAVAHISKDASNPQTRSRYASLPRLDAALRPHYTENGFTVTFGTKPAVRENVVMVTLTLSHAAGYEREYEAEIPCDGLGAKGNRVMTTTHAVGSAMTYGRRYLLCMVFNIMTSDDDGNAAGTPVQKKAEPQKNVTEQQLDQLSDMCDRTATDKRQFC